MILKLVPLTNDFITPTMALCKRDQRGDDDIPAVGGKEAFLGVINNLEGILPMNQIKKPVHNSPLRTLPVCHLLTVLGFIVPSLLSVIRLMAKTHFYVFNTPCNISPKTGTRPLYYLSMCINTTGLVKNCRS